MQGVFGFLISLASFLSIKVTSPVTHSMSPLISPSDPALTPWMIVISSAARGVLQTMLAVYIFGDIMSQWVLVVHRHENLRLTISWRGRVISIFLIIAGSVLYVYAKSGGDKKPAAVPVDPKALERGLGDVVFDENEEKRRDLE